MKIRRVGLYFQLLRKQQSIGDGRVSYKMLKKKVPIKCTGIDMVEDSVLRLLIKKEILQLERYLKNYHLKKVVVKEKESDENVFQVLSAINLELMDKVEYKNTDNNREAFLDLCKKVTKNSCDAGFAPEVLDAVLGVVFDSVKDDELEAEQAKMMIKAWLRIRKTLNKKGYSSTWYNETRNQ